jgi:aminoglycoside phosphotransferase (APT) family kinase protein
MNQEKTKMPEPTGRDLHETRSKLTGWLADRLPSAEKLNIEALRGPSDTGFSSDTLMFDLHFDEDGQSSVRQMVVRLEPTDEYGVFPEYDVALQFNMMKSLADTPVPVPQMYWLEKSQDILGAAFYVMEKVDGLVPSDSPPYHSTGWIHDSAPGDRAKLWYSGLDAMAEVHKLDWQAPKFSFVPRPPAGSTPLQAQLQYWDDYLSWGLERERHPLLQQALDRLRASQPADEPTGICWGDSRISNQIFQAYEVVAVIDWEMVFLGNPVADLAWFNTLDRCFTEGLGLERLSGFPDRQDTIARWEACVGRKADHYGYYELFAAFRFSAIMARLFLQMKHYEMLPADANTDVENFATAVLGTILAEVGA